LSVKPSLLATFSFEKEALGKNVYTWWEKETDGFAPTYDVVPTWHSHAAILFRLLASLPLTLFIPSGREYIRQ
jgi:hypothetical protein